jgi:hypothetical protein
LALDGGRLYGAAGASPKFTFNKYGWTERGEERAVFAVAPDGFFRQTPPKRTFLRR